MALDFTSHHKILIASKLMSSFSSRQRQNSITSSTVFQHHVIDCLFMNSIRQSNHNISLNRHRQNRHWSFSALMRPCHGRVAAKPLNQPWKLLAWFPGALYLCARIWSYLTQFHSRWSLFSRSHIKSNGDWSLRRTRKFPREESFAVSVARRKKSWCNLEAIITSELGCYS